MDFFVSRDYLENHIEHYADKIVREVQNLDPNTVISVRGENSPFGLGVRVSILHNPQNQSKLVWFYQTGEDWLNNKN